MQKHHFALVTYIFLFGFPTQTIWISWTNLLRWNLKTNKFIKLELQLEKNDLAKFKPKLGPKPIVNSILASTWNNNCINPNLNLKPQLEVMYMFRGK
jgi:hypothetical protein